MKKHYLAFSKEWFSKHQKAILWFLNAPVIKHWARWVMRIRKVDCPINEKINRIEPDNFAFGVYEKEGLLYIKRDFRTHAKFGKRMYYAFRPIWWMMHFWDWLIADRFAPKLSFGFLTLTAYPDAGDPGTDTFDAAPRYDAGATWATARDATDSNAGSSTGTLSNCARAQFNGATYRVARGLFLYKTSDLTALASISATVFSLCAGAGGTANADTTDIDIVSCAPASNTTYATSDFDSIGSTVYSSIAMSAWNDTDLTYNNFTLDANGINNVSKTGISKFACRNSRDTDNIAPTGDNAISAYMADQTGTDSDPKLVVTYTIPGNLFSPSGGVGIGSPMTY